MDSASELADYLDHLRDQMTEATTEMWKMMAGWTREQMIDAGLLVYYGVLKDLAHFAGVYDQDEWFMVDERVQRFKPLFNDEYGTAPDSRDRRLRLAHVAELQRVPHGEVLQCPRRDVDADPVLGARRRRVDRPPSARSVPASTSLPAKTGAVHHDRGKLSQDECNRLAKEFSPTAWDLRHYDDEAWVKNHPGDPRADELYRAAHASSAVLRDRGADVNQTDLEELRNAAGRSDEVSAAR